MSPCRAAASGLAATWSCSCPLPWPDEGVRLVIQDASADADHAHSGCVVTATVVVAPSEVMGEVGGASVTAHFDGDGPVDVATVEPHPAAAQATSDAAKQVRSLLMDMPACICCKRKPESNFLVGRCRDVR